MTPAFLLFVFLLCATAAMRLGEVVVSRRRIVARPDVVVSEPALFPAMVGLHTGLVVLPLAEVLLLHRPFVPAVGFPALAVLVVATVLRVWTLSTLGRVWNVRVLPPPPDAVVTGGPYRWIRHPNYLCVILEIAALPLVHTAWIAALVLTLWNAAVLVVRIRTEESVLMQLPAWREAFADRPRFLPFLF